MSAELGRLVKQKHPGAYDSIPDDQLGQQVLAKYPQYQSLISTTSTPQPAQVPAKTYKPNAIERIQSGAERVADFLGIRNFAEGLGATGRILAAQATGKPLDITDRAPSNRQVIGSAGNLLATLGTAALPGAGSLAGRVGQSAAIGAFSGASSSLEKSSDPTKIATGALVGGATGAAVPALLQGTGALIKKYSLNRAAKLYDSVLGVSKQEAKEAVKYGAKTTGRKLAEKGGLPGLAKTKSGIREVAEKGIDEAEKQLTPVINALDAEGIRIPTNRVVAPLQQLKQQLVDLGEPVPARLDSIISSIERRGEFMAPSAANALKREYYQLLRKGGTSFGVPIDELPGAKQIWRTAARSLREAIEEVGPRTPDGQSLIGEINKTQGFHLEVLGKIEDAIAKGEVRSAADAARVVGNLLRPGNLVRDFASAGVGAMVGGPIGAAALPVVERALMSTPAATMRAKTAAAIGTRQMTPEAAAALQRLLALISGNKVSNIANQFPNSRQ